MRRGMPRGRGNNRPAPRPQNPRQSTGGQEPMMTGHLQGLKDIDMELELLKRKREIIEQQQQILSINYRQRNDYEQPMFNESRDNRYDDYTRLYDDGSRSNSYGGGASRKRPHVQVWENESTPKRFSAPSRGVRKSFGSRLGPPPSNPRPALQRPADRPAPKPFKPRPTAYPPKKNFNPTKVTKTYAPAAPKLASYEPAERKKLVTEALASSGAADEWILREDVEPTRQMNGRLELALGGIMKQLRHDNPQSEELFNSQQAIRAMKQGVRDRVRSAMIGKAITTSENIKAIYYEMFPKDNDEQVLMKGLESQKNSDFIITKTDDPEVYFKKNMYRLMSNKLDEMTSKLEEIYTNQIPKKRHQKWYQAKPKTLPKVAPPQAPAKANENQAGKPGEEEAVKPDDMEAENPDDIQLTTDTPADNSEQPQADADQSKSDETPTNLDDTEKSEEAQIVSEEKPKNSDVVEIADDKEDPQLAKLVSTAQYKAFDRLMNYKIIHLLKKFSPAILKVMDVDTMYRKTKATILNETKRKLLGPATPSPAQNTSLNSTSEKPERRPPLQYYVKILGKPSLPKRKAMETFFEQFKPKSIKKHRTVHNLLFVGFADKESFDNILAANGTVIGRFTLDIKVSEKNFDKKKPASANDSLTSEVIGPELDEQITDLLSSIRKAEEESFSEDIVMVDALKIENGDQTAKGLADTAINATAEIKTLESETKEDLEAIETIDESLNDEDVVEIKDIPQEVKSDNANAENCEKLDAVPDLKTEDKEVKGTPTRASARLATPGGIQTRRMSKLND